ncbi:uncharacterized protein LOC122756523 [Drosophila santomea]|uniref:uncharacterized protein LOC122756523 n=1 Tax=Drosophila santomea TaxID=129105 RepID=UPI001CCC0A53|nr:uncharacterized protein LOC122756523 [Drosophila santomea]
MGQHGSGTRNDNGQRLVELCQVFQLVICGTIFPHKDVHKYSWTSPGGNTRNQIDHICISRMWRHSLLDRLHSEDENDVHIAGTTDPPRRPPLGAHLQRTAAEQIIGLQQLGRADWISKGTWDLIRRRNNLKPLADQLTQNRDEYRELCRAVKRAAIKDKRALLDRLATDAERAAGENNMRSLYQQIARVAGPHHRRNQPMGISHTTSPNVATDYRGIAPPSGNSRIPSTPPNVREIVNAVKKLKCNRAAGGYNIPAELLQIDTQLMADTLHQHSASIWEGETVPDSWKSGIIVKLPKKGDLSDCNNWRGITLLNTSYKILATLLNERLQEKIEPTIRDEQAGFIPHRSCLDQANTLRIITEQAVEWRARFISCSSTSRRRSIQLKGQQYEDQQRRTRD